MLPTEIHSHRASWWGSGQPGRLSVGPDALFVYGSLLFPEVLQALLGRVPNRLPASAPGWRVVALPGRVYPGLIRGPTTATGLLIIDLAPQEWRILDAFEDELYQLRCLSLSNGRTGWAYVSEGVTQPSADDWDATLFNNRDLGAYVEGCIAWRTQYLA
jgi:gamma-glutamylcyclotransferase (GGCT)/AIG2-like uncharacterized protein YtfP